MNIAVITAGGTGDRVGADVPKQFIEVFGKPILAYTIEAFQNHPEIDVVEVVCIKSHIDYVEQMKEKYKFTKLKWVTEGGSTFLESVFCGVKYLENKVGDEDIVIVHYGVSPFITDDLISDAIKVCKEKGNANSATDFYLLSGAKKMETSVNARDNYAETYLNREKIAIISSPHAFKYEFIRNLYKVAAETGIVNQVAPNTVALMSEMKEPIYFSKGSQVNIKITTPEDLELFKGWVLLRKNYDDRERN